MTMSDTEVDLTLIAELEGAIPCEVQFLHDVVKAQTGADEPAKYILAVEPACTGGCQAFNTVGRVTVLICQPCVDAANAMGWALIHADCGVVLYARHSMEPINKAADS